MGSVFRCSDDLSFLSWDTEDGRRLSENLLRAGGRIRAEMSDGGEAPILASAVDGEELRVSLAGGVAGAAGRIVFPFNPGVTPVTVIPAQHDEDGMRFPALVSAPDFGQLRVTGEGFAHLTCRLDGDRHGKIVDWIVEFELAGAEAELVFTPVVLPCPAGVDEAQWRLARRGWFGALQLTARWGEADKQVQPRKMHHPAKAVLAFRSPPGLLANNVISDPASCSLWFYADQALWQPELAAGVSAMPHLRRTLEYWLGEKMLPSGEIICYWDKTHFIDANASPLIAAWDYVEATGDEDWLDAWVDALERAADFLIQRDIDGDGLVEATQPGTPGTLIEPGRSCAWWDALNCGHKDAYTNMLTYRAWCCLAELEARIGREDASRTYRERAASLRRAFRDTLFNPATGVLAWWIDRDGDVHDFWSPTINGMAIEYGLVSPGEGREILRRIWDKLDEVGFDRLDLGVPPQLTCVPRGDYLLGQWNEAKKEDGRDTFQHYMNAGITAGHVLHFIVAHYVADDPEPGDKLLAAMLERQQRGGFHNGVQDEADAGIDWTDWQGRPCGYEGYLADNFRFLQAVLLRDDQHRRRLYRPMQQERLAGE